MFGLGQRARSRSPREATSTAPARSEPGGHADLRARLGTEGSRLLASRSAPRGSAVDLADRGPPIEHAIEAAGHGRSRQAASRRRRTRGQVARPIAERRRPLAGEPDEHAAQLSPSLPEPARHHPRECSANSSSSRAPRRSPRSAGAVAAARLLDDIEAALPVEVPPPPEVRMATATSSVALLLRERTLVSFAACATVTEVVH